MSPAIPAWLAALAIAALAAGSARAEVTAAQPSGFEVVHHLHIAAPPGQVWAAVGRVGGWWSPDHTYSHDARNLSLQLETNGCLCERWPGGSVRHLVVVFVEPERLLRLDGALGPLGGLGVTGRLTFALAPAPGGADLTLTYDVGGWAKGGLDGLAGPVDEVLGEQAHRLQRYVETGRPQP